MNGFESSQWSYPVAFFPALERDRHLGLLRSTLKKLKKIDLLYNILKLFKNSIFTETRLRRKFLEQLPLFRSENRFSVFGSDKKLSLDFDLGNTGKNYGIKSQPFCHFESNQ